MSNPSRTSRRGIADDCAVKEDLSLAWRYFATFVPQASSTVITAAVTFFGSAVTLVLTKRWDRSREIQQEHRKQKTPLYEEFITFLFRLLMSSKTGSSLTDGEMTTFMVKFTQGLTSLGF